MAQLEGLEFAMSTMAKHHACEQTDVMWTMKRFRGGLAFKAHRLCVSLNSRLESHKEKEKKTMATLEAFHQRSPSSASSTSEVPVGLCYQLGGDNISVLSAVTSLPADDN